MKHKMGDVIYPWGNQFEARIVGYVWNKKANEKTSESLEEANSYKCVFLEDSWAQFKNFRILCFKKGHRFNLALDQAFGVPMDWLGE